MIDIYFSYILLIMIHFNIEKVIKQTKPQSVTSLRVLFAKGKYCVIRANAVVLSSPPNFTVW